MFSASKRGRRGGDVACIFVHAGAGYHSVQNEQHHLAACNDAAKAAMAVMRGGGSAVDAVEIAVKVLEDREITNAGYGSNLTIDGVVECDAVVVDQFGRSGGAGAVAQIKNPISLARLLLDHTTQTLSLRRVPPNLLVGQGATNFAYEHNMPVVPLDYLISPAAGERWKRWKSDLVKAEMNRQADESKRYSFSPPPSHHDLNSFMQDNDEQETMRRAHSQAMLNSVWNEGQPISPPPSDDRLDMQASSSPSRVNSSLRMADLDRSNNTTPDMQEEGSDPFGPPGMLSMPMKRAPTSNLRTTSNVSNNAVCGDSAYQSLIDTGSLYPQNGGSGMDLTGADEFSSHPLLHVPRVGNAMSSWHDGSSGSDSDSNTNHSDARVRAISSATQRTVTAEDAASWPLPKTPDEVRYESPTPKAPTPLGHVRNVPPMPPANNPARNDLITDTVGAIAIDLYGNIACGASSGGIGMKHRGRIGPAALVGIGAAVIPIDENDAERQCVATVTSGTGEHMGTTQAASVCSERLYHNLRRVAGGGYEESGDDEVIRGFIERDFMGHPSVKQSHSNGAIGILSAKKAKEGIYLYFGHNTDSFALASMHSDELKPVCTMSRNKGNGSIAQGGRAIRYRRKKV
ncbi:hypothetical protein LTR35_007119 [Friedmanniomyces endolithicus]|uniref:N-terminal nucleophile aminohydrolase n=1 Tax=Friedmanniomyces endolithicus TaxID=329885 RepID=A0AAN6FIJ0_9PEZI|nr:hypothetical protein LTR35_007119 [Friedmanniomyces endolithicus]KAK0290009.1 hypothetical protein LTS00_008839 [Friedmanniomyces endolithicus]KAK0318405.1 hypothetical protein LTR82_010466 [Friedmanniomyces endolithicus]KAK1017243.1 hypothetical protein LTR54_002620 [Friedmanniomyces endolithicus]